MNLSIPVYIERREGGYLLRPLFAPEPRVRHRDLERGTARLAGAVRKTLDHLDREDRHDGLARFIFSPDFEDRHVEVSVALKKRTLRFRLLLVIVRTGEGRLVHAPALGDLWFDLDRGEDPKERAEAALAARFKEDEEGDGPGFDPDEIAAKAFVMHIDLTFRPRRKRVTAEPADPGFSLTGHGGEVRGDRELARVGRRLDRDVPEGMYQAHLVEAELRELDRALTTGRRRPVALVGPSQVGKSAIIHALARRTARDRQGASAGEGRIWTLSPQRLISGMSYVGQWEERLLAILKEARKRGHILHLDDPVGFFRAGVTAQSDLSLAQVMKPFLERRDVAILAEMTPETLRVLRERDRGFADLFHLIPVREPEGDRLPRILIRSVRGLEERFRCRFHPAVTPMVIDLQRRYARHQAFPGKAVRFLEQLAVKHEGASVARREVLEAFHEKSGLSLSILDDRVSLTREAVATALGKRVIGQPEAVAAMADVASIAKARLNDPGRPLISFLFLGPTGVGKTQCARALCAYLFGEERRLLRYDMNEYVEPGAASRLVGDFRRPEGLLTSAVRQAPFSVVLLDEIEKAHPEVFDLLLQLLDDGRLTDALGRTADFTNTMIILTSNLGARRAGRHIGFQDRPDDRGGRYIKAAEEFFRPEFFNRLDRIIPFRPLGKTEVETICGALLEEIFTREGLIRRKCLLDIDPGVVSRIAEEGYRPDLGARALKRAVEKSISRPAAARLAAVNPVHPTVVSVSAGGAGIRVEVSALREIAADPHPFFSSAGLDPDLDAADGLLAEIDQRIRPYRPEPGIPFSDLLPHHHFYYEIREWMIPARRHLEALAAAAGDGPVRVRRTAVGQARPRLSRKRLRRLWGDQTPSPGEILSARDLSEFLETLARDAPVIAAEKDHRKTELLLLTALLQAAVDAGPADLNQRAILTVRPVPRRAETVDRFMEALESRLPPELSLAPDRPDEGVWRIDGPLAFRLLRDEAGGHLFSRPDGELDLVCLEVRPASEDGPAEAGGTGGGIDGSRFPGIIRVHDAGETIADLRTGLLLRESRFRPEHFRMLLLGRLPMPLAPGGRGASTGGGPCPSTDIRS